MKCLPPAVEGESVRLFSLSVCAVSYTSGGFHRVHNPPAVTPHHSPFRQLAHVRSLRTPYPQTAAPPQPTAESLPGVRRVAPRLGHLSGDWEEGGRRRRLPHDTHPASDLHNSQLPAATFLFLVGEQTPRSLRSLSLNAKNITAVAG